MAQLNAAMTWEWYGSRYSSHVLSPFKLTYNKMLSHSTEFDAAMDDNPALAQSFIDILIPKIEYTYTFDRDITRRDHITFTAGIAEAGNIMSGLWEIFKPKGTKEFLGIPFTAGDATVYIRSNHYTDEDFDHLKNLLSFNI